MKITIEHLQRIEYKVEKYDKVENKVNEYRIVRKDNKYGLLYKDSLEIIPCIYSSIEWIDDNTLKVLDESCSNNKQYWLINTQGEKITKEPYVFMNQISDGLICVLDGAHSNFMYGFIDVYGNEVIPCKYTYAQNFKDGLALVSKDYYSSYLIDKNGEKVVTFDKSYHIYSYSEGFALACNKDGKQNYLDLKNKPLLKKGELSKIFKKEHEDFHSYLLDDFHDGMARVKLVKKDSSNNSCNLQGYINKDGKLAIPCIYNDASEFYNGYAKVKIVENNETKEKYINKHNQFVNKTNLPKNVEEYFEEKEKNMENIEFINDFIKEEYIVYNSHDELKNKSNFIPKQNIISNKKIGYLITLEDNNNIKQYFTYTNPSKYNEDKDRIIVIPNNLNEILIDDIKVKVKK